MMDSAGADPAERTRTRPAAWCADDDFHIELQHGAGRSLSADGAHRRRWAGRGLARGGHRARPVGTRIPIGAVTLLVPAGSCSGRTGWIAMVWSLLYGLTRNTLGVTLLRVRGDAAKDIEILVLRHQLAVLRRQVNFPALQPADRVVLAALSRMLLRPAGTHSSSHPQHCCGGTVTCSPDDGPIRARRPDGHRSATRSGSWRCGSGTEPDVGPQAHPGRADRLGYQVGAVWRILTRAGVDPAPRRADASWSTFCALRPPVSSLVISSRSIPFSSSASTCSS
jgi:hypothetical protein